MTVAIPAHRQREIEAAIGTLQERGEPLTNKNVYAAVQGKKAFVNAYMQHYRAQQRAASPVALSPVVPASPPKGSGHLRAILYAKTHRLIFQLSAKKLR
jgi:hypothetical protein